MEEISLQVRDEIFLVNKEVLCEHSDYFRAMFSGNYVESEVKEIVIDILDPDTMKIILQYMKIGLIDLSEYSWSTICSLAVAASDLQITELIKQIEYTLDVQTNESNWLEIMAIARKTSFVKLEQFCAAYGLFSFKSMKPEYVPTIDKLAWYLSHPCLDTQSELDVFDFGINWMTHKEIGADALPIILGCLDMKSVTKNDLKEMKKVMKDYENSLAAKVVDLLYDLSFKARITETNLLKQKTELCQKFTKKVWNETLNIVKNSKSRCLQYTPVVPVWLLKDSKQQLLPHCMYTYNEEQGFENRLKVAKKNLRSRSVVSLGLKKLVTVGSKHVRGSAIIMKNIKVYDTLRKEWTSHGVHFPDIQHADLVVVGGGKLRVVPAIGAFRKAVGAAVAYDLKKRAYRILTKLPDGEENPAVCSHEGAVYIAGQKNIYRLEDSGTMDCWRSVIYSGRTMSCIKSFKGYIYGIQYTDKYLYRFRPDVDEEMEVVARFSNFPRTIFSLGDALYVFSSKLNDKSILTVEKFRGEKDKKAKVQIEETNVSMPIQDEHCSSSLVLSLPPLCMELSQYHKRYLKRYIDLV